MSRKTVIYTGAGISVSANVGQAARGSSDLKGFGPAANALPTQTHYALAELHRLGLVHEWIQQNHDGLPQKASYPQEAINEIHGSWFDPSNPVVKYSGSLKAELFPRLRAATETADL